MAGQASANIAEDLLERASRPAALAAMSVLLAFNALQALYVWRAMADLSSGSAAQFGLIMSVLGLVVGLVGFAVLYFLSRKLVAESGGPQSPRIGAFIGFGLLYAVLSRLIGAVIAAIGPLAMEGNFAILPFLTVGANLIFQIALFPLLVLLVGLAHGDRQSGLGAIWSQLTARQPAIYGGYALLSLIVAALSLVVSLGGGVISAGSTGGAMLFASYLIAAVGQVIEYVYAICAYRAVTNNSAGSPNIFG